MITVIDIITIMIIIIMQWAFSLWIHPRNLSKQG